VALAKKITSRRDDAEDPSDAAAPVAADPSAPADPSADRPTDPPTDPLVTQTAPTAPTRTSPIDRNVPRGVQIAASWSWRVLLIAALGLALGWLLRYLSEVVIPGAVASLLAAMLYPVTQRLTSWGLPRGAAAALSVLGGLILIFGGLTLIGTQIVGQASALSSNVVDGFYALQGWLRDGPLPIDESWLRLDEWIARLQAFLATSQDTIASWAAAIGTRVGHFLAGFAIALFALFYFLYDGRGIWRFLLNFFPAHVRVRVDHAALGGWRSLVSYVRATILVALVDAVGVLIVALILGVPLAPALAALVFIGAFIPLIGAFVSGFVAVAVALVALGWWQALIMLAGIVAVMQLEGHILQPFLLGRAVKLHPLAVLLGIAIGVVVGGIVGALLSIPILAFAKSFIQELQKVPGDDAVVMPEAEARAG
jgi:putative heme transporter